jgi:uncharacterized protein (DUF1778 family)
MTVTLNLAPEIEQRLREKAARNGQTLEAYLERVAVRVAADLEATTVTGALAPPIDDAEFERLMDELDELPDPPGHLPPDFSRADIYYDHD